MRTSILFFLLIGCTHLLSAQNYNAMAVEGATWIYKTNTQTQLDGSWSSSYHGYHIAGDSTINNITYKKLYKLEFTNVNNGSLQLSIDASTPYTLIRDDIQNRKVYAKFLSTSSSPVSTTWEEECYDYVPDGNDKLIYDFNLLENDTIGICGDEVCTIQSIDNNVDYFNLTTQRYIPLGYTGIGSEYDLFYNLKTIIIGGYNVKLLKYCVSEELSDCNLTIEEIQPIYYPMIIEGATWIYKQEYVGHPQSIRYEGYHISGDTIITGTNYKKMYNVSVSIGTNDSLEYNLGGIRAYLREDIPNRKVYHLGMSEWDNCEGYSSTENEYLLYDFHHIEGDTVVYCGSWPLILHSVSLANYYGYATNIHKIGQDIKSERFGDFGYFFISYDILFTGHAPNHGLVTYCVSDELDCPYKHEGPNAVSNEQLNLSIDMYPNPANNEVYILSEKYRMAQISILSLDGKIVQSADVDSLLQYQLGLYPSISSGLYLLQITIDDGSQIIKKLLVN